MVVEGAGAKAAGSTAKNLGSEVVPIPSALDQAKSLFATNTPGSIQIGGRTFTELPNAGNAAMFSGATDAQVQQYFMELVGVTQLPAAVPLTIRGSTGVRYTVSTPSGSFTLRSVSSSESQTGAAWTIDIPKNAVETTSAKEIKFLR